MPRDYEERKFELVYISDGSCVDCAVHTACSTSDVDDSSKFIGGLSIASAFDIWEKGYTALMTRKLSTLREEKVVQHLQDALSGDVQLFFLKEVVRRSSLTKPSLSQLECGSARNVSSP